MPADVLETPRRGAAEGPARPRNAGPLPLCPQLGDSFARGREEAPEVTVSYSVATPPSLAPSVPSDEEATKTAPVPDATLASTALTATNAGTVSVKVTCPADESSCAGTITLRTLDAVSQAHNTLQLVHTVALRELFLAACSLLRVRAGLLGIEGAVLRLRGRRLRRPRVRWHSCTASGRCRVPVRPGSAGVARCVGHRSGRRRQRRLRGVRF